MKLAHSLVAATVVSLAVAPGCVCGGADSAPPAAGNAPPPSTAPTAIAPATVRPPVRLAPIRLPQLVEAGVRTDSP